MFSELSDKLQNILKSIKSRGRLTEKDIDEALREVRLALLEADVNFKVVKGFLAGIRERAIGAEVLESLTPGQQIIKIVHEELIKLLGDEPNRLNQAPQPPTVVMLVGLQGSGKTTTAAKLALHLRRSGQHSLMVAADTRRPAAVTQLVTLGKQVNIPVHSEEASVSPQTISLNAISRSKELATGWVILDTQGRLHVDEEMMTEVGEIKKRLHPTEVLLVADAMTGQDAVRVAKEFNTKVGLTGLILTKLDGDARGGAALSMRAVTGVPIKYIGTGEKLDSLEPFHPDRLSSRILGMGDVLTLIEKAQTTYDEKRAKELEKKFRHATFDLKDFLEQLQQIRQMGPLDQLAEMIPGFSGLSKRLPGASIDDKQLKRVEAIIRSMTPLERQNPQILDGSRRRRVARGSGTTPQDVNHLLNQFHQMQKLMKQVSSGKMGGLMGMLR